METRFCPTCGTPWIEGSAFCGKCGLPVANWAPATEAQTPAAPAPAQSAAPAPAVTPAAAAPAFAPPPFAAPTPAAPTSAPVAASAAASPAPSEVPSAAPSDSVPAADGVTPPPAPGDAPAGYPAAPNWATPPGGMPKPGVGMPPYPMGFAPQKRGIGKGIKFGIGFGVLAIVAVIGIVAFMILTAATPASMTRDLVNNMAGRNHGAVASLVDSDESFRDAATAMGVIDVPGSVTLSVDNLKVTAEPTDKASGDTPVNATYTLKWSGNGKSGQIDQTLSATIHKGSDGKTHLVDIVITPALAFDVPGYFGTSGTSADDANKVVSDLQAGTSWIPGVTVGVSPRQEPIHVDPKITKVPGHLASWTHETKPEDPGSKTFWDVTVSANGSSVAHLSPATKVTKEAVPAEVETGTISDADATAAAEAAWSSMASAISSSNATALNAMILNGPKIDASGVAAMKGTLTSSPTASTPSDDGTGPTVEIEGITFMLGPDGTTWGIDSSQSHLVKTARAGSGSYSIPVDHFVNGVYSCSATLNVRLVRVEFYTNGDAPEAAFQFTASPGGCVTSDTVKEVTVSWAGNSGTTLYPDMDGCGGESSVMRYLDLPDELTPDVGTIHITIPDSQWINGESAEGFSA